MLFLCPGVCGREDVDVLAASLGKASHLKAVYVMATFVGPCHTHAVKAVVLWERLNHSGVQGVHVGVGDCPGPGPAKEVSEVRVIVLPHLLIQYDDVGEAVPDQLSKGGTRILRRLPERLGLDGSELVEVSHEDDNGESTQDRSGVLPNRPNPVALLIDGVQHGETDHADFINEQDGLPLPQGVDLWLDRRTGPIEDVDAQGGVDGAATNVIGGSARRSQQKDFVFPLQKLEAKLHGLDDSGFADTTFASDGEKHLVVGLQGDFPMVLDGMGQDLPYRPKLFLVERQSLPDEFRDARSGRVGAQPGNLSRMVGSASGRTRSGIGWRGSGLSEVSKGRSCSATHRNPLLPKGRRNRPPQLRNRPPTTYAATVAGC